MHDATGTQLLLAFQSKHPTRQEQSAFLSRFGRYIHRIATSSCRVWNILHHGDVEDVVQLAYSKLLDPTKRFADCRCTAKQYLIGVMWNAAKQHFRFLRRLPACDQNGLMVEPDRREEGRFRNREDIDAALHGESAIIRQAVEAIYFDGLSLQEAAARLGMNRFRLLRERAAFFQRARARVGVA